MAVRVIVTVRVSMIMGVTLRMLMVSAQLPLAFRFNRNRCTSAAVQQESSLPTRARAGQNPGHLLNPA
jgi:hypothetical protein